MSEGPASGGGGYYTTTTDAIDRLREETQRAIAETRKDVNTGQATIVTKLDGLERRIADQHDRIGAIERDVAVHASEDSGHFALIDEQLKSVFGRFDSWGKELAIHRALLLAVLSALVAVIGLLVRMIAGH